VALQEKVLTIKKNKMSYRNPKIIDDKSGLIVPQAIEKATATLGKGIVAYGLEEKKRAAEQKKIDDKNNQTFITLANAHAKNSAIFDAGLTGMSTSMRSALITRNERILDRINEIQIKQQINDNADPRLSKELGELQMQITEGTNLGKTMIATAGMLSEQIKDPAAFKEGRRFFTVGEDGTTDESEAIVRGFGGDPGYKASTIEKNGTLYAKVVDPNGKVFEIPAKEFESKTQDLIINKDKDASVEEINLIKSELYNGKDIKGGLIEQSIDYAGEIRNGRVYTGSRKILNKDRVDAARQQASDNSLAFIESMACNNQVQGLYLKDLKISKETWQDPSTTDEQKREIMKTASDKLFNLTSGIKYNESTGNYYVNEDQFSSKIPTTKAEGSKEEYERLVDSFKTDGALTLADMGLSDNSRIGYKTGAFTLKNVVVNNGKLTFTLDNAEGNPAIEGAKKAITQTINITDTAALKNVLKLNNSLNDNQLEEYIKLIQQKRKDE
jgi:hypothetical protein